MGRRMGLFWKAFDDKLYVDDCETILNVKQHLKSGGDQVVCPKCSKGTCAKCKMSFHGKVSCEENMQKKYNMAMNGVKIHLCPKCGC